MDVVIGSGPAGIAVTSALLARGRHVTMLDGGASLPPSARDEKAKMAAVSPSSWTEQQIAKWQEPQFAPMTDLAMRYGSDHAQIPPSETVENAPDWFALRASHAIGGLSSVWGASVLPSRQADIETWPITVDDLAPHYQAITGFMPLSGRRDRLEQLLPALSMSGHRPLTPGPQGQVLLDRFDKVGERLAKSGVYVGQARQAVRDACQYCGMCLHGCPWDQIFSADQQLAAFRENPNFTYRPGQLVIGFSEEEGGVTIRLASGETLNAHRLYIAAGVLETAKIVLASYPDHDQSLMLQDSQHFFLPFLHTWKPQGRPDADPHHTLTEAFVEIDDPDVSPYLTHSQIYGWNEFYARDMIANYGAKLPGSAWFLRALARRLMVAQTFLHSDHCAQVKISVSESRDRLVVEMRNNATTEHIMNATKRKLAHSLRQAGLYALTFASRAGTPGASFHSGGTLPMSQAPVHLQTDILGRLHGLKNVHVVDASVLPSIPATTITLTVMANAHRIGSLT